MHILETSFISPGQEFTPLTRESVSSFFSANEDEDEDVMIMTMRRENCLNEQPHHFNILKSHNTINFLFSKK